MEPLDAAGFRAETGVSRETLDKLEAYAALLQQWQGRVNLVGRSTIPDLWRRHFLDSAQLFPLIPGGSRNLVDVGSGAGFPGLVLAIMGARDVHLIESDGRKATFLREAVRLTGAAATVHTIRAEAARDDATLPRPTDLITARALAPLPDLLKTLVSLVTPATHMLLLKGAKAESELTQARKTWIFRYEIVKSRSDPAGKILHLWDVVRAGKRPTH